MQRAPLYGNCALKPTCACAHECRPYICTAQRFLDAAAASTNTDCSTELSVCLRLAFESVCASVVLCCQVCNSTHSSGRESKATKLGHDDVVCVAIVPLAWTATKWQVRTGRHATFTSDDACNPVCQMQDVNTLSNTICMK